MLILCIIGNDWNYVRIMMVNVHLLDFRKTIGKKILKSGLFMLILCFVGNKWNYVRIMVINFNLLDFIQIMGNVEIWVIYVNIVCCME